jgi:hypothetical protein
MADGFHVSTNEEGAAEIGACCEGAAKVVGELCDAIFGRAKRFARAPTMIIPKRQGLFQVSPCCPGGGFTTGRWMMGKCGPEPQRGIGRAWN